MQWLRIAILALAIAGVVPARAVEVRAVRLWASPEGTQVVLEVSAAHLSSTAQKPAAVGVVKEVRMARRPSGELRVVLDLTHPIRAKSFFATPNDRYGYRLVVDLGGAVAADAPIKAEHARPEARDLIIAIDAGHGGEDPGAIGMRGTREKDVRLPTRRARGSSVG